MPPTGSVQQFVIGIALLISAILTGIVISWVGGVIMDGIYWNNLYGSPLVPPNIVAYAQSPFYTATSNMGAEVYFVNLFYAMCYALPIIGVLLFYQGFVKVQSVDAYGSTGASPNDGRQGRGRLRRRRNR
jgi:hypothetical protein